MAMDDWLPPWWQEATPAGEGIRAAVAFLRQGGYRAGLQPPSNPYPPESQKHARWHNNFGYVLCSSNNGITSKHYDRGREDGVESRPLSSMTPEGCIADLEYRKGYRIGVQERRMAVLSDHLAAPYRVPPMLTGYRQPQLLDWSLT